MSNTMVNYICGVCGETRKLPVGGLPPKWRIPKTPTAERNIRDRYVHPHSVVAVCSDGCESEHEESQARRRR